VPTLGHPLRQSSMPCPVRFSSSAMRATLALTPKVPCLAAWSSAPASWGLDWLWCSATRSAVPLSVPRRPTWPRRMPRVRRDLQEVPWRVCWPTSPALRRRLQRSWARVPLWSRSP
ncbi:unnamed protein product, partial [Symbiodinium sp. KB8]